MADHIAFTPGTLSLGMAVTASAHAGVALPPADPLSGGEYQFFNQSTTVTIFLGFGATATAAVTAAAIPGDGLTAGGIPVPPGWIIGFTLPPGLFLSAIGSAAGPSNLYCTYGRAPSN